MSETESLKIMRSPTVYETVDEVLEANAKWKKEQVQKYKEQLTFLKDSFKNASKIYLNVVNKDDVTEEEIKEMDIKLTMLKSKIVKFEQMVSDYESRSW